MRTHFDVLVRGDSLANAFQQAESDIAAAGQSRLRLWTNWDDVSGQNVERVLIVSALRDLTSEPELSKARQLTASSKRFLLFMEHDSMPAESIAESLVELGVRSKERLHLARLEVDDEKSFLRRFLAGLLSSDQDCSIMDAWWDADKLIVISPTFQRLHIPLANLPKLKSISMKDRMRFEIDPQGDFIHWPSHDIHMGWSQFQQAVDPQARLKSQQKHEQFNERYGQAIRALRESIALSQRDITGLDERTIRRIEQGKSRATANALNKLAKAHDMTTNQYMAAVAKLLDKSAGWNL
jgi:hypothetical protein